MQYNCHFMYSINSREWTSVRYCHSHHEGLKSSEHPLDAPAISPYYLAASPQLLGLQLPSRSGGLFCLDITM